MAQYTEDSAASTRGEKTEKLGSDYASTSVACSRTLLKVFHDLRDSTVR